MTSDEALRPGRRLYDARRKRIGTIDAVFADYLLVRTAGLMPVDLYVPRTDVEVNDDRPSVSCTRGEAHERWHRPLKRAPHPER